ncbi:hypothetical protein LCGC14_0431670 [marine sediment metagenome]|uniref:Metallo-beta-lactamase domain-containing protein n=1 Tax=marine sediment metagenome TaxID=412755 RepID=A0A0F9T678_9ZZZZ|nr:MBL fold metallo-hydrolase [Phycisphaerae bacterium]HDZ42990.1 MBL fold metallo-hydrolase [Phycisphaerae bacterium]
MQVVSLQSGSNGNCYVVEGGGVRVLVDAGLSGREARRRLASVGRDIDDTDALLVSHDHSDHSRCAGIYHRMFGVEIHATAGTMRTASRKLSLGRLGPVRRFPPGRDLHIGELRVETIPTPHDGTDPVSFVFDDGRRRLGILTDLGHVFDGLADLIASLDAVIIESNYDERMLETGPYPRFLKRRIRGRGGHISNIESARLIDQAGGRLTWACLAHLSQTNNSPDTALRTFRDVLGDGPALHLAGRHAATKIMTV